MNPILHPLHGVGLWVELLDKHGMVVQLEEEVDKAHVECDHLWKEL